MLGDEPHRAGPRREGVHALDEREPHHRPDRVARPTRPAGLLKIADQTRDLRAGEQRGDLCGTM